jgi:hypothetical protein
MTHYKYSPTKNLKSPARSTKVFKQTGSRANSKKNVGNKNNFAQSRINNNFFNLIFASAGILSVISLSLVFAPNLLTAKVAKAEIIKTPTVAIVTNYNNQEFKSTSKGKSFLQPVEPIESPKK